MKRYNITYAESPIEITESLEACIQDKKPMTKIQLIIIIYQESSIQMHMMQPSNHISEAATDQAQIKY